MALKPARAAVAGRERRVHPAATEPAGDILRAALPAAALDDRIAIVGTAGSGKTYAAKGFVERLLDIGARVAIVDPLGVWWGLRASADGSAASYPVVVFGGHHADVPIAAEMGDALGRMAGKAPARCLRRRRRQPSGWRCGATAAFAGARNAAHSRRTRRALHGGRRACSHDRQKAGGGHWNSGVAVLRNNGLIETDGRRYRCAALFRK